jgi:translation initiation factor 2 subunit 1
VKEMQVTLVDKGRRQIDLSPRYVTAEEAAECADNFEKSRRVHNLLKYVAEERSLSLQQLYDDFIYPLEERPWDAFEQLVKFPEEERLERAATLYEEVKNPEIFLIILSILSRQMGSKPVKLECHFNLTCHSDEGVLALRAALQEGIEACTDEVSNFSLRRLTFFRVYTCTWSLLLPFLSQC